MNALPEGSVARVAANESDIGLLGGDSRTPTRRGSELRMTTWTSVCRHCRWSRPRAAPRGLKPGEAVEISEALMAVAAFVAAWRAGDRYRRAHRFCRHHPFERGLCGMAGSRTAGIEAASLACPRGSRPVDGDHEREHCVLVGPRPFAAANS
jgi:hypothetical protein